MSKEGRIPKLRAVWKGRQDMTTDESLIESINVRKFPTIPHVKVEEELGRRRTLVQGIFLAERTVSYG